MKSLFLITAILITSITYSQNRFMEYLLKVDTVDKLKDIHDLEINDKCYGGFRFNLDSVNTERGRRIYKESFFFQFGGTIDYNYIFNSEDYEILQIEDQPEGFPAWRYRILIRYKKYDNLGYLWISRGGNLFATTKFCNYIKGRTLWSFSFNRKLLDESKIVENGLGFDYLMD